ncbi:Putative methyltransferase [Mycobacteroides abscessus subsp. bolletii]|uniref:hypothetical protein n=1 Tax=Mycobacteroides abscessus TaxID=36809 RepID=UPI0009D15B14|nr:hypothetical protein [Mycobacteroides abscessus]SKG00847.1 putative methyltransferase [Mycobacteroides abscessus subsp. bolletii]SKV04834.1 Putative methyltransferase [Mycobacteroides abscessus subsp. bolletii]SLF56762.1 Putative methyltransferase [Mycobacteroides abscessus subsp. bolletii]
MWSATTDDGPFNGLLERPALRSLIPRPLAGRSVLDAGCGSGAQCAWLLGEGADVEVTQHFWRRPLGQVADAFADAGLLIERISEPRPSAEAIRRFPTELRSVVDSPSFIVYRLRYWGAPA